MKNLLLTLLIIAGFSACNRHTDADNSFNRDIQLLSDSAAYTNNAFSDTSAIVKTETGTVMASGQKNTLKKNAVKSTSTTVSKSVDNNTTTNVSAATDNASVITTQKDTAETSTETVSAGNTDTSAVASSDVQPEVQKKKGLNKATQGAIIGGVTGAVGGAIISKKKGVGAVVGGIVGAAGGYIIGNKMDKKDKDLANK